MSQEHNQNTALSLFKATGILQDWVATTQDATVCSVCAHPFGDEPTYLICRFPEPPEGSRNPPKEHEGHTACQSCALSEDRVYIGEGGACGPCLRALGGRRSHIKLAGIALAQPSKNSLANRLIGAFHSAKKSIDAAREEEDHARRQEGADRRAAAVEEVRRRREEAAAAERKRHEAEQAAKEAEERKCRLEKEEADAKLLREKENAETKRFWEEEITARKKAADEEIRQKMDKARRDAKRLCAEAHLDKNEMETVSARASDSAQRQPGKKDILPPSASRPNGRKKRVMTEESRASFAEKKAKAAADKRQKLEKYEILLKEKQDLERQISAMRSAVDMYLADHTSLTEDDRSAVGAVIDAASFGAEEEEAEEEAQEEGEHEEEEEEARGEEEEEEKDDCVLVD